MQFWFRQKYQLPPTDPRFLALTPEDIEVEYWAHQYFEKPDSAEEFEDDDFDVDAIMAAAEDGDWDWGDLEQ